MIATERDIENNYSINPEKKEYVLNWFAYILQHPESRNKTCLQIKSLQGIGKNILSNSICDFIGNQYSISNIDINNILGNFNGMIDNKLFVCINEVNTAEKDAEKLKSIITDDTLNINVKYGGQYTSENLASYLIYTNNLDTKTITKGDRRFVFINSEGIPYPKQFYADICEKNTCSHLRSDLHQAFINHLLSRDLSNYSPDIAPEFDKQLIYDKRNECRSPIFNILLILLHHHTSIIKTDFLKVIQDAVNERLRLDDEYVTLSQYYSIPELEEYNDLSEYRKTKITSQTIGNIMNFDSQSEIISKRSKAHDNTRDKYVYMLQNPITFQMVQKIDEDDV